MNSVAQTVCFFLCWLGSTDWASASAKRSLCTGLLGPAGSKSRGLIHKCMVHMHAYAYRPVNRKKKANVARSKPFQCVPKGNKRGCSQASCLFFCWLASGQRAKERKGMPMIPVPPWTPWGMLFLALGWAGFGLQNGRMCHNKPHTKHAPGRLLRSSQHAALTNQSSS